MCQFDSGKKYFTTIQMIVTYDVIIFSQSLEILENLCRGFQMRPGMLTMQAFSKLGLLGTLPLSTSRK